MHGYLGGVCGIHGPIWPEPTLFIIRIKLWFQTSYLGSFLNKAWYDRVMMVSLVVLELLPIELLPIEARKHHRRLVEATLCT